MVRSCLRLGVVHRVPRHRAAMVRRNLLGVLMSVLIVGGSGGLMAASSAGASSSASASAAAAQRRAIGHAASHLAHAQQTFRRLRRALKQCQHRHPAHCAAQRRALRHAAARLARARRALTRLRSRPSGPAADPGGGGSQPVSLQVGLVAGSALSYEMPFIQQLGGHTARMEFGIDTPASEIAPIVGAYAAAGIRPLLLASFNEGLPTAAEARSLGSWAAEFGPGGSYWQGKNEPPGTAVSDIEFGNETSYSYQFSDNSPAAYAARAQTYALRFKDAQIAIHRANPNVGLLAIGDNAQQAPAWVSNMFKAVPDLGQRVAGWTIHPYGPDWASRIDSTISSTAAAGAPSTIPIWITEWGVSTDNGRCLQDDYGWNRCMTYDQAAATLDSTLSQMQSRYGSRLGAFFIYTAHDQQPPGTQSGREYYFGALQSNGDSKGAYTAAVKAALAKSS